MWEEARVCDFYLACVGRIESEDLARSALQHGHLILWNVCSHSEYVFESNTLDEKSPDEIRGRGWGGNLWVFQPMFQDMCSTGKNEETGEINFKTKNNEQQQHYQHQKYEPQQKLQI